MSAYLYHIGIDVSKDSFDAAAFTSTSEPPIGLGDFSNNPEGIAQFHKRLKAEGMTKQHTIICIEATGAYSELLCYQLHKFGYQVCLEAPLKVKRAFNIKAHKTDPLDALKISEYAFRFCDRMIRWNPKPKLLKYLETWLTLREQLVKQKTAIANFNQAIGKLIDCDPLAIQMGQDVFAHLTACLGKIEKRIDDLVQQDTKLSQQVEALNAIDGFGKLTAVNLAVLMNLYPALTQYTKFAAYIGICPYQCLSGKSVRKPARISHLGPPRLRKLLHLCARSVCTHKQPYKAYYQRKLAEGKPPKLIINNVANKLLRVACALINSNKPYIENYVSVHPKFK